MFPDTLNKSDLGNKERCFMVTPESMQQKAMDLFANELY
jgi:hypothetical protein